jgi:hypothetical protein
MILFYRDGLAAKHLERIRARIRPGAELAG